MNLKSKKIRFLFLYPLMLLAFLFIGHSIYLVNFYRNEIHSLKTAIHHKNNLINELSGPIPLHKYFEATNFERKDWQDHNFIKYEATRVGPGEQGKPFDLTSDDDIALNAKLFKVEGLFVVASDRISVNRSVPDTRLNE